MNNILYSNIKSQLEKYKSDLEPFALLTRSIPILIGIFIFFNPFPHTTAIKEICYYLSILIVIILLICRKTQFSFKSPLLLPFCLFVLWTLAGIFFAIDPKNSIHDFYSHLIRHVLLYYVLINFYNSKKHFITLSWIIIISTTIFSIGTLYYYYYILGHSILSRFGIIYGAGGLTETQNVTIGLLCIFAIIQTLQHLLSKNKIPIKAVMIICLFPLMASVVLTQNRCFVIALFASVIFLCLKKKKILLVLFLAIAVVIATTPIKNRVKHNMFTDNVRLGIYYRSIEIIKDYPVFGIGYGQQTFVKRLDLNYYNNKIPDKYKLNDSFPAPHNILFDIAIRTGLIGLGFYLYIIFTFSKICWQCIQHKKNDFIQSWGYCIGASFISYMIIGCLQPLIGHMPEVMLFTIFSMMTILWSINEIP